MEALQHFKEDAVTASMKASKWPSAPQIIMMKILLNKVLCDLIAAIYNLAINEANNKS